MATQRQQSEVVDKSTGVGPVAFSILVAMAVIGASLWWLSPTFENCLATSGQSFDLAGRPLPVVFAVEAIDANHNLIIAVATIVLTVFTMSLWAATNQLRRSTDKLWSAGEHAMVTSNRAWVFTQPWPGRVLFADNGDIIINEMELHCYGNSPATVTELYVAFSAKEPSEAGADYPGPSIVQTYNLAPGNGWPHVQKFTTTDAQPYVYGYVRYVDQFGFHRESRYCYRLTKSEKIGFRTAGGPAWSRFT